MNVMSHFMSAQNYKLSDQLCESGSDYVTVTTLLSLCATELLFLILLV